MLDAQMLSQEWRKRIEFDLASFMDPGTTLDVSVESARSFRVAWKMRGEGRDAVFSVSPSRGVSVHCGGRNQDYREFIVGSDMANVLEVATRISQASTPGLFVATRAIDEDGDDASPQPAVDLLTALLDRDTEDATRVLMLTGDAGAGKTRVLRKLVHRQADRYVHGRTKKILLYVNAQGRALARLDEALATELQDLRVGLTYHSVAVLARLGVLVPVIDGFDELLGVSGYDDAFSSLAGFLEQLDGEGHLLVSARSVYYETEFLARSGNVSNRGGLNCVYSAVRVLDWSEDDSAEYLEKWGAQRALSDAESEKLAQRVRVVAGRHAVLLSKPLFFARTVELLRENPEFSGGDDLLQALVDEYLTRETEEKLLGRWSESLLTEKQYERLMRELAQEMWNQETRELDHRSVQEVAEYFVVNEDMPGGTQQVIVERMPALAFLSRAGDAAPRVGIAFEHELFFFCFLAKSMASEIGSAGKDLRMVLSRSAMPEDLAVRVAGELREAGELGSGGGLQVLLDRLSEAGTSEWRRSTQVRENAGLVTLALLRAYADLPENGRAVDGCVVRSVVWPGSHLRDVTLRRCAFDGVTVRRTDLTATKFLRCEIRDTVFLEPRIARESTRLELRGIEAAHVLGIRVPDNDSVRVTHDPEAIAKTLRECGAPLRPDSPEPDSHVSQDYVVLMDELLRAYRRANPVCKGDPNLRWLFEDRDWGTMERLLVEHELVTKEHRVTKGQPKEFLRRRFRPEQIMAGLSGRTDADPRVRSFWRALAHASRKDEE